MNHDPLPLPEKNRKADAARAALLSAFVIPGAGQMYNRQWGKGVFLAILFLVASLFVLIVLTYTVVRYYLALQSDPEQALKELRVLAETKWQLITLTLVSVVLYIYSIVDAYKQNIVLQEKEK